MKLYDWSSHPALAFRFRDRTGSYRRVVVMRATYTIAADGSLAPKTPAPSINFTERCFGDTRWTAPRDESHLAPEKPNVDLIVHANAYAPGGLPSSRFEARAVVRAREGGAPLCTRRLAITGPREWRYGGWTSGWTLTEPEPVTDVPLRFELAYGGTIRLDDERRGYERPALVTHDDNPIGRGFVPNVDEVARSCGVRTNVAETLIDEWAERNPRVAAPQIEHVESPLRSIEDRPKLAGWGLVAKHWGPRYRHAGTYDETWRQTRHPLVPTDFDPAYWNGASEELQLPTIPVDGVIELHGLMPVTHSADQSLRIRLPGLSPMMSMHDVLRDGPDRGPLRLDTVIVDLYAAELTLLFRVDVADGPSLAWIELEETP